MSLTPKQQEFLQKYVRKYRPEFLTKGKKARAKSFGEMREELQQAMLKAPPDLPEYAELIRAMREADEWGEKLKFNRASELMQGTLGKLQQAIKSHVAPKDSTEGHAADPEAVEQLLKRLKEMVDSDEFKGLQSDGLCKEMEFPIDKARGLLEAENISLKNFQWAERLVEEVESKRLLILDEQARIEKTRTKLKKYLSLLKDSKDIAPGSELAQLEGEVGDLLSNKRWSSAQQSQATSAHLRLMLALADDTQTQQKDFKKGQKEMVLAVRRKNPNLLGEDGKQESNFKVLVKPAKLEVKVLGFKQGGGAPREAMGSFLGNELQRMAGLKVGVPDTKVISFEGEYLMGSSVEKEENKTFGKGQKVVSSVQSFEQGCKTVSQRLADANLTGEDVGPFLDKLIPKKDLQQMAVFDLISLNCDRHDGNMMLDSNDKLVPIDHGNIMPTKDGLRRRRSSIGQTSLIKWTTAAKEKLSPELIECIERLDVDSLALSMREQGSQMQKESDEIDLIDLNEGVENVRRSAAFVKFAARDLTLEQIYIALAEHQNLIFFSKDEKASFKMVVESITNKQHARAMLALMLGLPPEKAKGKASEMNAVALEKLHLLNWFSCSANAERADLKNFLNHYPARCMEILEKQQHSSLPKDAKGRFKVLGGRDAAIRLAHLGEDEINKVGNDRPWGNRGLEGRVEALEVFYAVTGQMP